MVTNLRVAEIHGQNGEVKNSCSRIAEIVRKQSDSENAHSRKTKSNFETPYLIISLHSPQSHTTCLPCNFVELLKTITFFLNLREFTVWS